MSFTNENLSKMEAAMKAGMGVLFRLQTVEVHGVGNVDVKLHVQMRASAPSDLTGGAIQEGPLAVIDADDWDEKVGRKPYKGDVVQWAGDRYAVESVRLGAPGGNPMFYRARLRGG